MTRPRIFIPTLLLTLTAAGFAAGPAPAEAKKPLPVQKQVSDASSPAIAIQQGRTIAHTLLALELEGAPDPAAWQKLDALIDRSVAAFGGPRPQELEPATAQRFFRVVDETLIEGGAMIPPGGTVEMLQDALKPRQLTDVEFQRASQDFANARRSQSIQAARKAGDPLYYFDCDLAAIIYLAVAERLKFPASLVEVPGHNFVRWQSPEVTLNWDPNDAISKSDQQFAQMTGVTREDRTIFGYLENRTRERILSYWLTRRGQRKASEGKAAAALADFRAAVKTAPEDVAAQNELAWLLATSPDDTIRNGREALEIAEKLVARSRRINWLETLAAACAETGDFHQAISIEEEARHLAAIWLQTTKRHDSLAGFDACLRSYGQNLSYAGAAKAGLIKGMSQTER